VTDHSEFGLYFAKGAPTKRVLAIDTLRDLDFAGFVEVNPEGGKISRAAARPKPSEPLW
jgi:hypothetical protein